MADSDQEEEHTSEIKNSREEAERIVARLQNSGWDIYPEKIPLQGQNGFYCVQTIQNPDGTCSKKAHSVRWNLFGQELHPITIKCLDDPMLLSFLWQHTRHPGFDFFEYGDGDFGFVCYCRGNQGCSLVLRVPVSEYGLSEEAYDLLDVYDSHPDTNEDDEDEDADDIYH